MKNQQKPTTTTTVAAKVPDAPKPKPEPAKPSAVNVSVPVHDMGGEAYCMRRVDVDVSARQAKAMRLVFDGLQYTGKTVQLPGIETYRPVARPTDAIRYLLDQIADAYDIPA